MALNYYCRHCGTKVGSLDHHTIHAESLGFNILSSDERQNMLSYQHNGDIHIKTICEDCQETLERNPDYHQYESFLQ